MGVRLAGDLTTTKTSVVTATFTKLLNSNNQRQHLLVKYTGEDFYVFYQEATPISTDEGTLIDATYLGEFWDSASVPSSSVWVYHTGGVNQDVFVREA
jgi:hypothetical protein